MKFIEHFKSSFFTALLECRPGKRVDDGVDAGGLVCLFVTHLAARR